MKSRNIERLKRSFIDTWDRAIVRGNLASIFLLLISTLSIITIGAFVIVFWHINIDSAGQGVLEMVWEVLLRALSPDQLSNNRSWLGRIVLLTITLLGLLIVSTLISISNSIIERRIESIRRGRAPVHLENHLSILNWNDFGIKVLREIAAASSIGRKPEKVSVLCDQDPVDLMTEIRQNIQKDIEKRPDLKKWIKHPEKWITVRRGNAHHTEDLHLLSSIVNAKAAIILHDEETDESQIIRTVLAINASLQSHSPRREQLNSIDLSVISFLSQTSLADRLDYRLAVQSKNSIESQRRTINYIPISPEKIRNGIETQVSRHRGLSAVYLDLFNFDGEELYIENGSTFNTTFGDLLSSLDDAIPICIIENGEVNHWPNWDMRIDSTVEVVLLAENRSKAEHQPNLITNQIFGDRKSIPMSNEFPENFLFVGWNESAENLAKALSHLLPDSSKLTVLLRESDQFPQISHFCGTSPVVLQKGLEDPLDRMNFLENIHHVVVFADLNQSPQLSDAAVLIDLIACRFHADQIDDEEQRFTIVAELRRRSSRHIAGARLADDLLVSDSLMACMAAQLAMDPRLEKILNGFLSIDEPTEIVTRRVSKFKNPYAGVSWKKLIPSIALETGEIPIGFRRQGELEAFVELNPNRETLVEQLDEIILVSRRAIVK